MDDPSPQTVEVHRHITGIAVVSLTGEHDISTVSTLEAVLDGIEVSPSRIVVDLTAARFIDSSVVKVLVTRSAATRGRFSAVTVPGTPPARVFELLSLTDVLPTYPTVEDAIERFHLVG
jgi:anti-sigma B factor antagonist